jgi:hypothetical protein
MRDAITAEPRPDRPSGAPLELRYLLDAEDYVAYWVHLASLGAMPRRAQKAMRDSVGQFWGLIWAMSIFVSMPLCAAYPPVGLPCIIASAFGVGFGFAFMLNRIDRSPGTCFQGWLSMPYRWLCLLALLHLARSEAQEGTLDTQSHYRFTTTAEGFILTTEPIAPPAGQGPPARREDRVSWAALEDAGLGEGHVFLTVRKGVAVIIPRRCFANDADFYRFTALLVRGRTRDRQEPSSTAIFAPEDRLLPGGNSNG